MKAKWIKKSLGHYKNRHEYEIYIKAPSGTRGSYAYLVHVTYDFTAEEEVDFYDYFSSIISLKQSFDIKNLVIDND